MKMNDFGRMLRYDRLKETDLSYHTEQTGPSRNGNIVKYGFQQCPYFTIVRETAPSIIRLGTGRRHGDCSWRSHFY